MKKFTLGIFCLLLACKTKNVTVFTPDYSPGPPAIIYKTKADYTANVPVLLSDKGTEIIAYPHPRDLISGDGFFYPSVLKKGYLLDNKGIGKNVAFLKLTYKEYAQLQTIPTPEELYALILDKDPLVEMCECGNRKAFTDITTQVNKLIKDKKLRTVCKVIK